MGLAITSVDTFLMLVLPGEAVGSGRADHTDPFQEDKPKTYHLHTFDCGCKLYTNVSRLPTSSAHTLKGRRDHPIIRAIVRSPTYNELVETMVAKLRSCKEESCLEHCQAGARWDGVKVLHLQLPHRLPLVVQGDLVDVAVLTLQHREAASSARHLFKASVYSKNYCGKAPAMSLTKLLAICLRPSNMLLPRTSKHGKIVVCQLPHEQPPTHDIIEQLELDTRCPI